MKRQLTWDSARIGAISASVGLALAATVAGLAVLGAVTAPVAAQVETEACRCVDAAGNQIENCTCMRMPRMQEIMPRLAFLTDNRPRLGISVEMRQTSDPDGAIVTDVVEGGPADEAGLREGDVITHLDGRSLAEPIGADAERDFDLDSSAPVQRLLALARELEPGQEVEVQYRRDGQRQTTMLEAADLSDRWGDVQVLPGSEWNSDEFRGRMRDLTDQARLWQFRGPGDVAFSMGRGVGGLELVELNPALGAYFGAEDGVLVTDVTRSNGLGLRPGDVVLSIGGREVRSPQRFRRILGSYGEEEDIEFRIVRDGSEMTVTGRMRYQDG